MENIVLINNLDPVNDGFEKIPEKLELERINCGLVINVHGEYKRIDEGDIAKIWRGLEGRRKAFILGKYLCITNDEKLVKASDNQYVVGSILAFNVDGGKPQAFSPEDVTNLLGLVEKDIVILSTAEDEYFALELAA